MTNEVPTGGVTYHPSKESGWEPEYTTLWFEYLNEKGCKDISKGAWQVASGPSNWSCAPRVIP